MSSNVPVNIPTITFENLEISNKAPYFSPGTWGFPTKVGARFAGFELGFDHIGMFKTPEDEPALNFNAHIQISDDTTKIGASGGFAIVGKLVVVNGEQHWRYKRLEVHQLSIDGSFAGVATIHGSAIFFQGDSIYGTGFRGALQAKFEMVGAEIQVVGQFGRVNDYKYFLIDAMYCAGPGSGINLAGAFELNGFGGGAYYHMSRPNYAASFGGCGNPIPTAIGASLSGIIYVPTDTVSLGIKLTVSGATVGTPEAFNANASLEFQFSSSGGLDKIWLYGNGKFMAPLELNGVPSYIKNQLPNNTAAVKANVSLLMDFQNSEFTGTLETYMNVAGVLRGIDPVVPDRVCFAQVKFSKNEWYIKIGGPADSSRAGIMVMIPGMKEPAYIFKSYLQIGNNIDPLPVLPPDILSVLNPDNISEYQNGRSNNQSDGIAFGVDVQMGGNFKFLILYADMDAHFGFDVNIAKSTLPMLCNGEPFGINGWYAQGQIYAAISVKMGLEVKVFGNKKQFEIMNVQVGAALEAKLPNPFWAHGAVAYHYSLLNGLVHGEGDFDFEVGEKCVFSASGSVADLPVILDVRPAQGNSKVAVSSLPSATFNFPVDEIFSFTELGGVDNSFKITLDTARLYWRGYSIPVKKIIWAADKRKINIVPNSFLPGNDTIRMLVSVHIDSNGVIIGHERRDIWFTTGNGLHTIPPSNVLGSYPMDGQYNYYKDELSSSNKGYIQLDRPQPDVMIGENQYMKVVRFRGPGGVCSFKKLNFSVENFWENKLEFPLPENAFFESNKIYEMQIVDYPKDDPEWGSDFSGPAPCICNGCITPIVTPPNPPFGGLLTTLNNYSTGEEVPSSPTANNSNPSLALTERIVYSAYFRVSQYGRFSDKMAALQGSLPQLKSGDVGEIGPAFGLPKTFDVPITIEPFDWCDMKFMDKRIEMNSVNLPISLSHSHFRTGLPLLYLEPLLKPNYVYTLPGPGMVTTSLPPGSFVTAPEFALYLSWANNTNLRILKSHYINNLPAAFAGNQKMTIAAVNSIVDGAQGLLNSMADYESQNISALRSAAQCYGSEPLCDCSGISNPSEYDNFVLLSCIYPAFPVTSGTKSYPLKFKYTLPGINQAVGDYYFIDVNH